MSSVFFERPVWFNYAIAFFSGCTLIEFVRLLLSQGSGLSFSIFLALAFSSVVLHDFAIKQTPTQTITFTKIMKNEKEVKKE